MKKQFSIIVKAPIEKAFDAVDNTEKIHKWMGGALLTEFQNYLDPETPVGTKFKHVIPGILKVEGEVIAYNKPLLLGVGERLGPLRGTFFYYFKMLSENKTEVNCELEVFEGTKTQSLLTKTMSPLFSRLIKKHLQGLKRLAEEREK